MSTIAKHTPGEWRISDRRHPQNACVEIVSGEFGQIGIATLYGPDEGVAQDDGGVRGDHPEREANAHLIAAAPDHSLICWAMCVAAGRWEPWGDGRGEFCINGLRYSTELDDFGCPKVNDAIRAAILKAKGDAQ